MHNPDWDDYRFILAVAERGTLIAAAQRLGVNHTTVLRRLSQFEKTHGLKLFTRTSSGHLPTIDGEAVIAFAREMSDKVNDLRRELLGDSVRLQGTLRVTTTDSILSGVLTRHLAEFSQMNPLIHIDLTVTSARLSLTRRDADVAIRPARRAPEGLTVKRAAGLAFAVYAPADMPVKQRAEPLTDQVWVGLGEALQGAPPEQWLRKTIPESQIAMRADTFTGVRDCVRAGVGIAILPCCIGDTDPGLARLGGPMRDFDTSIWVLNHRDLQGSARVAAFVDHIVAGIGADAAFLEARDNTPSIKAMPS